MKYLVSIAIVILISACTEPEPAADTPITVPTYEYPTPVDTESREIQYQVAQIYGAGDVSASNNFRGARLNGFSQLAENSFQAQISPENSPINESPWYAFKIWAVSNRTIDLTLTYEGHGHRYHPKLSTDGINWNPLDSAAISLSVESIDATINIGVGPDTLWVAAQEIHDSERVSDWIQTIAESEYVTNSTAGVSGLGRPLHFMNITKGDIEGKPAILIISRQHPPEVTGYFAMQSFIETIVAEGGSNGFLDAYRLLVYPLMNPDGVDLGHYRHNTGGVDLNRDWSQYNQPEIEQVTYHMTMETTKSNNDVLLGLDFHSTYYDVYYTPNETVERKIPDFTEKWLSDIQSTLGIDDINEQAGPIGRPTSSGWFNQHFGATGITYEIGDDTPREFIKTKGQVSARAMMRYFMDQ